MTQTETLSTATSAATSATRVAIVGATGYAGQELVRLLARHPRARLTMATGSQATSAPRRLPALARIWDGDVVPLDLDAVSRSAEVVFLALPEAASADVAPGLLAAGARVIDLSGAFRLRDAGARAKWYPATKAHARPASSTGSPSSPRRTFPGRPGVVPGLLPDGSASGPPAPRRGRTASRRRRRDRRRQVGGARAPARRRRSARTSARTTAASPPTASSATGTRRNRAGAGSRRDLHPAPGAAQRGLLSTIYGRLAAGTAARVGEVLEAAHADRRSSA